MDIKQLLGHISNIILNNPDDANDHLAMANWHRDVGQALTQSLAPILEGSRGSATPAEEAIMCSITTSHAMLLEQCELMRAILDRLPAPTDPFPAYPMPAASRPEEEAIQQAFQAAKATGAEGDDLLGMVKSNLEGLLGPDTKVQVKFIDWGDKTPQDAPAEDAEAKD